MNLLLSLNKKFVLFFCFLTFTFVLIFLLYKYYFFLENESIVETVEIVRADITNPRFAINNPSKKIFITAKEGNFMDDGKILLKDNVKFTSNDFSIMSDNVIFDRKEQTAKSNDNSTFKSNKTIISSEGFDIYDSGNKINFYGKAIVILE